MPSLPEHDWLKIVWMGVGIAVLAILIFDLVWYLKFGDSLSRRMLHWLRPHPVWQWIATVLGFLAIWHLTQGFPWDVS